eukprot:scaffold28784_cov57-Phaeocystis_antarctica.AAC.4
MGCTAAVDVAREGASRGAFHEGAPRLCNGLARGLFRACIGSIIPKAECRSLAFGCRNAVGAAFKSIRPEVVPCAVKAGDKQEHRPAAAQRRKHRATIRCIER